jgi:hypothetical protein
MECKVNGATIVPGQIWVDQFGRRWRIDGFKADSTEGPDDYLVEMWNPEEHRGPNFPIFISYMQNWDWRLGAPPVRCPKCDKGLVLPDDYLCESCRYG